MWFFDTDEYMSNDEYIQTKQTIQQKPDVFLKRSKILQIDRSIFVGVGTVFPALHACLRAFMALAVFVRSPFCP